MLSPSLPLGLLSLCFSLSDALRIPVKALPPRSGNSPWSNLLAAQECSGESGCIQLSDALDVAYASDITLGGKQFHVLLDTGSSDLWVNASRQPIPAATILHNMTISERYSDGSNYTGPIAIADLDLQGFHVNNQYFTYATESRNGTATALGLDGILGLGFSSISEVYSTVKEATGSNNLGLPFLYNLFSSNQSLSNTIAFSLGRISHTNITSTGGVVTIGEIEPQFEAVKSQTALQVVPPNSVEWTFPVDGLLIEGQSLNLPAPTVASVNKSVGLIDTGTSNILVPLSVVRAIYEQIEGAQTFLASPTAEVWVLPCSVIPPSVTFVIGGQQIPIHPLDLNVVGGVYETAAGGLVTVCFGGIIATDPIAGKFDFVLGTPFMRNAYTVFDYGNLIENSTSTSGPSIQFLAVTSPPEAVQEFNETRSAQLQRAPPASGDQIAAILNGSPDFVPVNPVNPTEGNIAHSSSVSLYQQLSTRYTTWIAAASLLFIL